MQNYLPRPSSCRFSEELADRAIEFFRKHLRHTKGQWAGRPFNLRPFQEYHLREIFGRVREDGITRQIQQVYWEVPKKNGKSEIAAGIANKLLNADDEPGAEIYGAAADRSQASIVFNVAASMVGYDRELKRRCRVIRSTKRIIREEQNSFYHAVSSDVATKHGYDAHGIIFDEVHTQRDLRLWEALTFGSGAARRQPLIFAITTAGIPGESPVAEMLHSDAEQILNGTRPCPPEFYPVVYAAPPEARWDDPEVWYACNPALGDFLPLSSLQESCERAKRRPSEENSFRRLCLNQWLNQETRFIQMEDWDACASVIELENLKRLPCYGGLDLAATTDFTALVLDFMDSENGVHYWFPFLWIPEALVEKEEWLRPWVKAGYVQATTGAVTDYRAVRAKIHEIAQVCSLAEIAYDPWNASQIAVELEHDGFKMVAMRQGFNLMSSPTKEFERLVVARRIRHSGHPVLRWMVDCLTVKQDQAGYVRPVKPQRLKSRKRIDAVVAGIMALDRATRNGGYTSAYEERGILFV